VLSSTDAAEQYGRSLESTGTAPPPPVVSAAEGTSPPQPTVAEQHDAASADKDKEKLLVPPGLTKRGSQRSKQDAAVVMPSERSLGIERVGVQFGSLALFDGAGGASADQANQQEPTQESELQQR
jgi:hypothetical protein